MSITRPLLERLSFKHEQKLDYLNALPWIEAIHMTDLPALVKYSLILVATFFHDNNPIPG